MPLRAYDHLYGSETAQGGVQLLTSTRLISVNADIFKAFEVGILSHTEATPLIMQGLGMSQAQIDNALRERAKEKQRQEEIENSKEQREQEQHAANLETQKAEIALRKKESAAKLATDKSGGGGGGGGGGAGGGASSS